MSYDKRANTLEEAMALTGIAFRDLDTLIDRRFRFDFQKEENRGGTYALYRNSVVLKINAIDFDSQQQMLYFLVPSNGRSYRSALFDCKLKIWKLDKHDEYLAGTFKLL